MSLCVCSFSDALWLIKPFFVNCAKELIQLHEPLMHPADTLFLTPTMLEDINWEHQPGCGSAWRQAVEDALKNMSLATRYASLKQRFPQTLASAGVQEAGRPLPAVCPDKSPAL